MTVEFPEPFLEVRVSALAPPPLNALCAGYEAKRWRARQLGEHLFQWIPFAALSQEFQLKFAAHNFLEMLRVAAAHIYATQKSEQRGELGELLLHLACIQQFGTLPVLCKLILKTSRNDTVKGFDGVHLIPVGDDVELWLGESKFYVDGKQAIREAIESIEQHIAPEFLSAEKAMLIGHIAPDVPNRAAVVKAFQSHTSSDELLRRAVFPVLIAYESTAVKSFQEVTQEYIDSLSSEVKELGMYFSERAPAARLKIQLIFVPMGSKAEVVAAFDKMVEAFQ
jgi:hypothetical protein